jgi:hypothetical protein
MLKSYTEPIKYRSKGDNFDLKLLMFYNIRIRVCLLIKASYIAFLIMLKGLTLDYYYTDLMY